jgi:hypothetical protein
MGLFQPGPEDDRLRMELFYKPRNGLFRAFARKPGRLFCASFQVQIAIAINCKNLMAGPSGGACYMPDVDADYKYSHYI